MKKHWSDVARLPVVSADEDRYLGRIGGVFMDPEQARIIGFLVGYSKVLVPMEIEKWQSDAVRVGSAEAIAPIMDILRIEQLGLKRTFLTGKRVISKSGRKFGRVRDFLFEVGSGTLLSFEVSKRFLWIEWGQRIFVPKDIEEVTARAIVLNVEPEQTEKVGEAVYKYSAGV